VAVCHGCSALERCRDFSSRVVVFGVAGGLPPEDPSRARANTLSLVPTKQIAKAPAAVDPEKALALLSEGLDSRQVAKELGCSDRTIRRIMTRTAIRRAPVPPIDQVPVLADLPHMGPNDVAFFRSDDGPHPTPARPILRAQVTDVDPRELPSGRALQGHYDQLASVTVAVMDLFVPAQSLTRDEIVAATQEYIPARVALANWASSTSQPTSVPGIRVLPPGMAAVHPVDRIARGARAYLLERIQGLVDARCLVPAPDGLLRISRPAWETWISYRLGTTASDNEPAMDTLF